MRISNEFTVNAPVERVWHLLTDVEAVAPCVPGVRLTGVDGPLYSGAVRVKVGSVVAAYSGTARFTELDEKARRAVLVASGRASRGSGSASATVTARLRAEGGRTAVGVETDLTVTGRLSEVGLDAIGHVAASLTARFAKSLEEEYGLAPYRTGGAGAAEETGTERSTVEDSPRAGAPGTGGCGGTETVGGTHPARGANGAFQGPSGKNDDKIPEKITEKKMGPDQAEHPKHPLSPAPAGEDGPPGDPLVSDITGGVTSTQSFPDHADLAPATAPGGVIADRVWPLLAILVVTGGMILGYALFS